MDSTHTIWVCVERDKLVGFIWVLRARNRAQNSRKCNLVGKARISPSARKFFIHNLHVCVCVCINCFVLLPAVL